jgi:hypothetical protein
LDLALNEMANNVFASPNLCLTFHATSFRAHLSAFHATVLLFLFLLETCTFFAFFPAMEDGGWSLQDEKAMCLGERIAYRMLPFFLSMGI